MSNLIYSINATLPIFLLIILGKVLKTTKIINDEFTKTADRYVFRIALPALLFSDLTENNVGSAFDGKYVLFCFSVTIFSIAVLWGLTEKFMKNEEQKGAFIQGSYRSSAAILGLAFINNMYDSVGMAPLMIIGWVALYYIFAVIIVTLKGDNGGIKPNMNATFMNVMKTPILLSILIALPFALLNLHFPSFVNKAIGSVANTATPLALISIGASFEGKKALKKMKPTLLASFIKLILLAGLFLPLAVFFGYRNQELMALLVMLGSPTTVSSYIMAKNTGNDGILTSSIIVLTTLLSSLTLTLWIFVLKSFGVL